MPATRNKSSRTASATAATSSPYFNPKVSSQVAPAAPAPTSAGAGSSRQSTAQSSILDVGSSPLSKKGKRRVKKRASLLANPPSESDAAGQSKRPDQPSEELKAEEKVGKESKRRKRDDVKKGDDTAEKDDEIKVDAEPSPAGKKKSKKRRKSIKLGESESQSGPSQPLSTATPLVTATADSNVTLVNDAGQSSTPKADPSRTDELMKRFQAQGARAANKLAKPQKTILTSKDTGAIDNIRPKALPKQSPIKPQQLDTVQVQLYERRIANMTKETEAQTSSLRKQLEQMEKKLAEAEERAQNEKKVAQEQRDASAKVIEKHERTHEALKEAVTCGVCFESYNDPHILSCGHVACKGCLQNWFKTAGAYLHEVPDIDEPDVNLAYRSKVCHMCRATIIRRPARMYHLRAILGPLDLDVHLPTPSQATHEAQNAKDADPWHNLFPVEKGKYKIWDEGDGVERCPECCCEIDGGRCEGCGVEFSQSEGEDDVDDRWEDESEASGHEVFGLGNVDLGEIMEVEPVDLSDDDSIGLLVDGSDDQSSEDQDVDYRPLGPPGGVRGNRYGRGGRLPGGGGYNRGGLDLVDIAAVDDEDEIGERGDYPDEPESDYESSFIDDDEEEEADDTHDVIEIMSSGSDAGDVSEEGAVSGSDDLARGGSSDVEVIQQLPGAQRRSAASRPTSSSLARRRNRIIDPDSESE